MIAISSHRPHSKSDEYAKNQIRAKASWDHLFDRIYYFGEYEAELASDNTQFIHSQPWPSIREMAEFAAEQDTDYSVIINADIFLTDKFADIVRVMNRTDMYGATTRRRDLDTGELGEDRGRDVWVLRPAWWKRVAKKVPRSCRIGHNQWDTWMFGFMRYEAGYKFGEFTNVPCVFHPKHDGRNQPFVGEVNIKDKYENFYKQPDTIITIDPLKQTFA